MVFRVQRESSVRREACPSTSRNAAAPAWIQVAIFLSEEGVHGKTAVAAGPDGGAVSCGLC